MATIRLVPNISQGENNTKTNAVSQKKKQIKFQVRISVLLGTLLFLISFVAFQYLTAFNQIASQGVVINDLQRSRAKLIIENQVWNMRIAQLKSMDVIQQQDVVKKMPLVLPSELEFIDLNKRNSAKD